MLFDLDGLLVDSEPLWTIAEHRVAESLGGTFTPQLKERMIGKRLDLAIGILLEGLDTPQARAADPHTVGQELMAHTAALFAEGVPLQPGAEQLLDALGGRERAARTRLVVLPPARRRCAHRRRRPPLCRQRRRRRGRARQAEPRAVSDGRAGARVVPARCVVLEDARAGLESAIAAGCACVYVPTFPDRQSRPQSAGEAEQLPPRAVQRDSLLEVDLALLSALSEHPGSAKRPGSPAA